MVSNQKKSSPYVFFKLPCAYSEFSVESIFSTYATVTEGRESLTIISAVALIRVASHGPPTATPRHLHRQYSKTFHQRMVQDLPPTCGLEVTSEN